MAATPLVSQWRLRTRHVNFLWDVSRVSFLGIFFVSDYLFLVLNLMIDQYHVMRFFIFLFFPLLELCFFPGVNFCFFRVQNPFWHSLLLRPHSPPTRVEDFPHCHIHMCVVHDPVASGVPDSLALGLPSWLHGSYSGPCLLSTLHCATLACVLWVLNRTFGWCSRFHSGAAYLSPGGPICYLWYC